MKLMKTTNKTLGSNAFFIEAGGWQVRPRRTSAAPGNHTPHAANITPLEA
jgi:hypothetical protein